MQRMRDWTDDSMSARHNTRMTQEVASSVAEDRARWVKDWDDLSSLERDIVRAMDTALLGDDYCTCGNDLHGDNLCMRSACQWEGMKR